MTKERIQNLLAQAERKLIEAADRESRLAEKLDRARDEVSDRQAEIRDLKSCLN